MYFPLCSWLGRNDGDVGVTPNSDDDDSQRSSVNEDGLTAGHVLGASSIALAAAAVSLRVAARWAPGYDLPISTVIAVAAATLWPHAVGRYARVGTVLGTATIYLFFATAGWTGGSLGSSAMLKGGPALLGFLTTLYTVRVCAASGKVNSLYPVILYRKIQLF